MQKLRTALSAKQRVVVDDERLNLVRARSLPPSHTDHCRPPHTDHCHPPIQITATLPTQIAATSPHNSLPPNSTAAGAQPPSSVCFPYIEQ